MWPPRIIAKLSALEKMALPGSIVTVSLPALMTSGSSSSARGTADAEQAVLALQDDLDARRDEAGDERGDPDAEVHVEAVAQLLRGAPGDALAHEPSVSPVFAVLGHVEPLVVVRRSMRFSKAGPRKMRCT